MKEHRCYHSEMSGDSMAPPLAEDAEPAGSARRWQTILGGAIIVLLALAAYHNSFTVPLLFDDHSAIEDNPSIRQLWPLWKALVPPANSLVGGRPVVNLSLAFNYALNGTNVWGYHAFNLAAHILAGLTLFGILRRTLERPGLQEKFGASTKWLPLIVAALWVVHPLQTETVTYISQRCELLMGLFYLLTLYCFTRGVESRNSTGWFILCAIACLMGAASKEVMITAPVMVGLYDRTFISKSFRDAWSRHWGLYLALLGSWVWLGYSMYGLHHRGVGYGLGITGWRYALTECRVIVDYLRLAWWPHPLVFDYEEYLSTWYAAAPYAFILAVLITCVLIELKRHPAIGFLGAWFFVILAPTSSVVPVAGSPMAEHRMYLSLIAVITLTVVGACSLKQQLFCKQRGAIFAWMAGGVLVIACTFLSIERNRDYQSEVTLWRDTVAKRPNNPRANYNLGNNLVRLGQVTEALGHYEQAIKVKPDYAEAHYNLAIALAQLGRTREAVDQYQQALQIQPGYAEAHNNLAVLLARSRREAGSRRRVGAGVTDKTRRCCDALQSGFYSEPTRARARGD